MSSPLAIQLYTLRAEAARDFVAVLERVAEIGYLGVETVELHGMSAEEFRARLDALGLQVIGTAVPLPDGPDLDRVIDEAQAVGNDIVVSGLGPEYFASLDAVSRAAERFNEAAERIRSQESRPCSPSPKRPRRDLREVRRACT